MNAMTMRTVRMGGELVHMPVPIAATPAKSKRKARIVPDPIKTNGESAAEQLRLLIERAERIKEEIRGAQDDLADVYAEAKGRGFDAKAMKRCMDVRPKAREQFLEEEGIFETYAASLGML